MMSKRSSQRSSGKFMRSRTRFRSGAKPFFDRNQLMWARTKPCWMGECASSGLSEYWW